MMKMKVKIEKQETLGQLDVKMSCYFFTRQWQMNAESVAANQSNYNDIIDQLPL